MNFRSFLILLQLLVWYYLHFRILIHKLLMRRLLIQRRIMLEHRKGIFLLLMHYCFLFLIRYHVLLIIYLEGQLVIKQIQVIIKVFNFRKQQVKINLHIFKERIMPFKNF